MIPRMGVEEEFHLVDLETARATPAVEDMLAQLDGDSFAPELQRSLIEQKVPLRVVPGGCTDR